MTDLEYYELRKEADRQAIRAALEHYPGAQYPSAEAAAQFRYFPVESDRLVSAAMTNEQLYVPRSAHQS